MDSLQYLAAALVIVLHEACSSLPEEYDLVWRGRRGAERTMFLVNRCVVAMGMLFAVVRMWCRFRYDLHQLR